MEREVQVGQLVAGKYRIEQVLGRGGMGVVMLALHEQLNQRVALKFLTDNAYQHPEAVARFVREARAAVQIQSEHVARVMDVGTLESGAPYMVMEYLRGRDLKDVSTRRGAMPVTEAVDFVIQACDALAEAHALGIVHRDLKPSNLFLTERPDGTPLVKVLDFGISKALHKGETSQMQMTASAAIMGSPQYMSPEQIRSSKNVDARADIWALGTILHELLTGAPAYVADTVPGLLAMIVADAPPPLSASRPDAPHELEATILRCLQKDRDQRFASVSEFARALERFASNDTRPLIKRIARVLGDSAPAPSISITGNNFGQPPRESIGHSQTNGTWARTGRINGGSTRAFQRPLVWVGAALGIVGFSAGGWFLLQSTTTGVATGNPSAQAAAAAVAPSPGVALAPPTAEVKGPSPSADANRSGTPVSPSALGVRPIEAPTESEKAPPSKSEPALNEPLDDELFVKEAKAPRVGEDDLASARDKRKPPPNRPRSATTRNRPSPPRETAEPAATPPSKKNTTLDLFDDTK